MVTIWLKCPRKICQHEWEYEGRKGRTAIVTSCPICHTTLSVPKAAARYRQAKVLRAAEKRRNRG